MERKRKRDHLLAVLNGDEDDSSSFIVKTTIESTDEWLHSFYYFNDNIPTEEDFENAIANFLTFRFNNDFSWKGYLFEEED